MADVCGLPAGRLPRGAQLRAVCVHIGGDHVGAELRNHARHAPQQATVAEARRLYHADRLDVLAVDGHSAARRRHLRLPQVCRVPAVRDDRHRLPVLRRVSHVHQRRRLPHPHGLLPQDVLRHPRITGKFFISLS